ncbi:hypothetical protein BGZ99_008930 [Dissophora globulifera]|uniref:BHLH domain-containing protein n=1 Tax=Dissophora globulifera TaxID=979702 RepID=A0A9P6RSQ5_9FUNG|nr:hypothetical protein BGZ99_008930 [Dissophora globulifera]
MLLPPSDASTSSSKAKPASQATKRKKADPKSKVKQDSQSFSFEVSKPSTSKPPKTFRFEGSISSESFKTTKSFDLAGVNILNRKPLDTKTALDKLQRRRETHNRVERKRRDCINQLIDDLTNLLPPRHLEETTSKCHRVNVLRGAVNHIKFLSESNDALANSIRAIQGDDALLPLIQEESKASVRSLDSMDREISMDVDDDGKVKEEEIDEDSSPSQHGDSSSRSVSPAASPSASSISTNVSFAPSAKRMAPPPVIITDAPSPSTDQEKAKSAFDSFSLESHPRSNSFSSSAGDQASPRSGYSASPTFPPSPISPLPQGRPSLFPPGDEVVEGGFISDREQRQQLSSGLSHSTVTSPSLPPISSLANLHLKSPSGHLDVAETHLMSSDGSGPGSSAAGRTHRAGNSLPPLMIPEPHHLHPSYLQGAASNGNSKSGTNSKRSSLTLSPRSAEHPPISPFMLSPMLSRSPSMGPVSASSPGNSPYPNWGQEGSQAHFYGYSRHGQADPVYSSAYQQHFQGQSPPPQNQSRQRSSQPLPIFIQEEPWNVQRKRSMSSVASRGSSKASAQDKKKLDDMELNDPTSPTSSIASARSYSASPNPKKRTQLASHVKGDYETEDAIKRSKQMESAENDGLGDKGVAVVVKPPSSESHSNDEDHDAAQALTSLAHVA